MRNLAYLTSSRPVLMSLLVLGVVMFVVVLERGQPQPSLLVRALLVAAATALALHRNSRIVEQASAEAATARNALERQRTELQLLFDLMPAMVWFKDTQNGVLRVNQRAAQRAGRTPEEMEGLQMEELYPEQAAGYLADDLEVIRSKAAKLGIVEHLPDGRGGVIWIRTDKVPYCDPQGKVIGIVVMAQDITEHRRAEELTRLLETAMKQTKESIMVTSSHIGENGPQIAFVNPAFTSLTGYASEEAVGKTARILHGPLTEEIQMERMRDELKRGLTFEGQITNYRKDGSEFISEWQVGPLRDAQGNITHFVALQRDITARRRMESQLFQSQKLETVGKLAGGVAHEFNSILTAIIGQAQLLLDDLPPDDPLRENATEIHNAAERAADLTRQLLAYGRKQVLRPQVLNLGQVLAGLQGTLRHLMGPATDVRIISNPSVSSIRADAGQIEQIIMNLAMNAADSMPDGGSLILETANVTLDEDYVARVPDLAAGEFVMLAVTDTGMGLSQEAMARAFEPFFTTKEVGEGIGLGLSTCYGIAKQSGGHISVYSEACRGATFKVYLPKVDGPPVARAKLPDLRRGTETILLVEDDPALREMANTLLTRLGYRVFTAANGLEALRIKQHRGMGHVDLLFTDLVMPHMNGKELAERILAQSPHTKVLFTSAYAENAAVHQGVMSAGTPLLQKPYTPSGLAQKLRKLLDS